MRFGKTRLYFIENQNSLDLIRRGNITNYYKVPRFNKVSIHVNFSNALKDLKSLGVLYNIIFLLSGTKPSLIKARKSIAQFKVRKGSFIGCKALISNMYKFSFIDYIFLVALNNHYDYSLVGLNLNQKSNILSIGFDQFEDFKYLDPIALYLRKFSGFDIQCSLTKSKPEISKLYFSRLGIHPLNFIYKD